MTQYQCPHCQHVFQPEAVLPEGQTINCLKCGREFAAAATAANPAPGPKLSEALAESSQDNAAARNLAAMFNQMTPGGAEALAAAFNAGGLTPPKATEGAAAPATPEIPPIVIGSLGCLLPIALILGMCSGIPILIFEPFERFLWIGPLLGWVAGFFVVKNMWQRWTMGRAVWTGILCSLAALITYFNTANLSTHHALKPVAEPLITEFRTIDGLPRSEGGTVAYGHVFPLARPPRGTKERSDPVTPELDFDLYDKLPVEMRVSTPTDEIRTVVLIDWWWNVYGEYENQLTGGRGRAYVGKCTITVIDRQTKKIIAETTLVSSQVPPPKKRTAMNWYGSQPSYDDVVKYLKSLPQEEAE